MWDSNTPPSRLGLNIWSVKFAGLDYLCHILKRCGTLIVGTRGGAGGKDCEAFGAAGDLLDFRHLLCLAIRYSQEIWLAFRVGLDRTCFGF